MHMHTFLKLTKRMSVHIPGFVHTHSLSHASSEFYASSRWREETGRAGTRERENKAARRQKHSYKVCSDPQGLNQPHMTCAIKQSS